MLYLYMHLATCVWANSYRLVHYSYVAISSWIELTACFLTFYCDPYFLSQIQNNIYYIVAVRIGNYIIYTSINFISCSHFCLGQVKNLVVIDLDSDEIHYHNFPPGSQYGAHCVPGLPHQPVEEFKERWLLLTVSHTVWCLCWVCHINTNINTIAIVLRQCQLVLECLTPYLFCILSFGVFCVPLAFSMKVKN